MVRPAFSPSLLKPVDVERSVTHGPFAGLEAVYQMTDAQQRAMVLLHILSQPVPVKIDAVSLRKVG